MRNSINTGLFFGILAILYVVSPLVSFLVSLLFFKKGVSHFFMVAFAVYFGYQLGPILDLLNHYNNYLNFKNHSLSEMFLDPFNLFYGQEPYHIVFKYVMAKFGATDRGFSACAAAVYTITFIFFFRQLKPFYNNHLNGIQLVVLLLMVVSIDFYWYLGLRFWTGTFFLMIFYTNYVITGNKVMLFFLPLGALFHYVLILPAVLFYLSILLKNRRIILMVLIAISYVFKYIEYGFLLYAGKIPFVNSAFRDKLQTDATLRALKEQADFFRNDGNIIYQHRTDFIFFAVVLFLLNLYFRNKNLLRQFPQLFAAVCLTLVVANFGYSEYVFYTRMYKLVSLLISLYLFLILSVPAAKNMRFNIMTKVAILGVALFCLLISLVQIRTSVFNIELWLGNFFVEVPIQEYSSKIKF